MLAAGTKTYQHGAQFEPELEDLERVPDSLRWVVDTLTDLGYRPQRAGADKYLLDPSRSTLTGAVRAAAHSGSTVIIYYTGHGMQPTGDTYWLVTTDAAPGELDDAALEANRLPVLAMLRDAGGNALPEEDQPQVLIILDCCFSGAASSQTLRDSLLSVGNPRAWVLASASRLQWAQDGKFAAALRDVLLDPETGPSQELLDPFSVNSEINKILKEVGQTASLAPPKGMFTEQPPFFPNPGYVPHVRGRTVEEQQHWVSRLRGVPTAVTGPGLYVTGRTGRIKAIEDLARWIRGPEHFGPAVVTGSPGCGKSALLALPVLLSDARTADALTAGAEPDSLVARASGLFAGLSVLGLYARGMNPYEVAGEIAKNLGSTAESPSELLDDLEGGSYAAGQVIVIDAADEALDAPQVLSGLLLPLSHHPMLRIVIGTRRLPPAETSLLVNLDSDAYRDPEALADYTRQLLTAAHEPNVPTPYRDRDDVAAGVAAAIVRKATQRSGLNEQAESFLLAQLLARSVRDREQPLNVSEAEQLPGDLGTAFDADLRRLGRREPVARALLTALAWANGPGLPWGSIWVPVARALASRAGAAAPHLEPSDARWLMRNAAAYIVEDLGAGDQSVFRPFHDLLAAHLRGEPGLTGPRRREAQRAVYDALLDAVPGGKTLENWKAAHPYIRAYLAQHAAAAGASTLAELTTSANYLAVANQAILGALLLPVVPELRDTARSYRRARPLLGEDADANAGILSAASGAVRDTAAPSQANVRQLPRARAKGSARGDGAAVLSGHSAPVNSVAFGTTAKGQALLASASDDQTIRLWDPVTGAPVGKPLTGHEHGVSAVAFGSTTGGQSLLASGGDDHVVRLWDPDNSAPSGEPLTGHTGWVGSLTFGATAGGQSLLASGGDDHVVRLWDPDNSAPSGKPLAGHTGWVTALALAQGKPLLASAASDGTVRLWNLDDRTPVGEPLTGETGRVTALALAPDMPLLASASSDGTVCLWNLHDRPPSSEPFTGHEGGVSTVAFGHTGRGQLLLATGGDDQMIRLWNPVSSALPRRGSRVSSLGARGRATPGPVLAPAV